MATIMIRWKRAGIILGTMAAVLSGSALAQESATKLLENALNTALLTESPGKMTGEGTAWHAAWHAGQFLPLAKRTGDLAYLEAAITYFDALLEQTYVSPDGFRGWVGPYIYDREHIGDVHISDAILLNPMLEVAEFVLHETPTELRRKYQARVQPYIAYAEKHVLEKWKARKTWWEDGPHGTYFSWDHYLDSTKTAWEHQPEIRNSNLGLPHNKNVKVGITHLRVYRLTGNPEHRDKARKIFNLLKSRLALFKNGYTWNYWEPVFPGDILSVDPPRMGHWVGTHPYRDYQASEVDTVVEAFHSGITFTPEDIDRFVATNLTMWNGSFDEPSFVNSDFAVSRAVDPGYQPPEPSPAYGGPAGARWAALSEFSEPLARLGGQQASNLHHQRKYPSFPDEYNFPFSSSRMFSMVFAMPSSVEPGEAMTLGCKVRDTVDMQIQLRSEDGSDLLETLDERTVQGNSGGHGGLHFLTWKAHLPPGAYRIRWLAGLDYRDFPIEVR